MTKTRDITKAVRKKLADVPWLPRATSITQEQLAALTDMSPRTIERAESPTRPETSNPYAWRLMLAGLLYVEGHDPRTVPGLVDPPRGPMVLSGDSESGELGI